MLRAKSRWAREKALSKEEAEANTSVWWDMKSIPIPSGYDAGRVGECIKRTLENLGYCGPVTITAYGDLQQTPEHVLRALSSSGITLYHSYYAFYPLRGQLLKWKRLNPPPATIMLIHGDAFDMFHTFSHDKVGGYNIVVKDEWDKLITGATVSESSRQFSLDKCSVSGESAPCFCTLCFLLPAAQSVESFITHRSCEQHVEPLSFKDSKIRENQRLNQQEVKKLKTMNKCTIIPRPKTLVEANKLKKKMKKKKRKLMKQMLTK